MKIKIEIFILIGLVFYFLDGPSVLAKNDPRDHHLSVVATSSSSTADIDTKEKDLGRGESVMQSDLNRPDVDSKERDLGRGELSKESSLILEDIDSGEKDLGQGEPFIQSEIIPNDIDSAGKTRGVQAVGGEILVGTDFTDAIKGKNFTDQSLLNSITLQRNPSGNDDKIGFKNNAGFLDSEQPLPPNANDLAVSDATSSPALPK